VWERVGVEAAVDPEDQTDLWRSDRRLVRLILRKRLPTFQPSRFTPCRFAARLILTNFSTTPSFVKYVTCWERELGRNGWKH